MSANRRSAEADFDAIVIGGGPAGATAAEELARAGHRVALLERGGRIKPCGGAIPPRLIADFAIPAHLLKARIRSARMVAPSGRAVDMPIDGGFVGMVDREEFDEWLRRRAVEAGVTRLTGIFSGFGDDVRGQRTILWRPKEARPDTPAQSLTARLVVGADGARSLVAKLGLPNEKMPASVFAYHEIVASPAANDTMSSFEAERCDVFYQGEISPDFYGWVFPHGETTSIGTGTAIKGYELRKACSHLRAKAGLADARTIRREGAPIPLKPLRRWDDGRGLILAGDAAGVVAPASGEGIYYAMESARIVAQAGVAFLATNDAKHLAAARKQFLKDHGQVFAILRIMQGIWYRSDWLRERFVAICRDPDVQRLTWESYMHKRMERASPATHARILLKNVGHYFGWKPA